MKIARLAVVLAAAGLAACTTLTPEERRAKDEATCREFGFRKGSEAFAQCLLSIEMDRRAERRARLEARPFDSVVVYRPVVVAPRPRP